MTLPDIDDMAAYGPVNDFGEIVDPTTERPARDVNKAICSQAAMSRVTPRAWATFHLDGSPAVVSFDDMWGGASAPTLTLDGTGIAHLVWPTSVSDELGASHSLNLRFAEVDTDGGAGADDVKASVASPTRINVHAFLANAASNLAGATITVWGY